jgi:hypothetical protein
LCLRFSFSRSGILLEWTGSCSFTIILRYCSALLQWNGKEPLSLSQPSVAAPTAPITGKRPSA